MGEIGRFHDELSFIEGITEVIRSTAERVLESKDTFDIGLCGGRSPEALYRRLSRERGMTGRWRVFFTDERCVPPDDSLSNYGMIKRLLLDPAMISPERVFRIRGEHGPETAAAEYQELLEREASQGLDLIILGLGADGHIASLFPGSPLIGERDSLACPVLDAPDLPRVTITPGMIFRSGRVILLVRGEEKREAFRRFLERKESALYLPSLLLHEHEDLHVVVIF